jgi:acyl-CoA synthetase (AMP-forming)/AMP-acid ligase II
VRISIRSETGLDLSPGQTGEVCIEGPGVIREYENNPDATARSFFGEWFRTGDQGILDEDGYLHLTGRLKELINRGGEKISPREIDELLLTHPAVAEAVCFGVPHPTWGEEVEAAVVLRPELSALEADLLRFCGERLADFKRPKKIRIVESIPRTATGKIQRLNVAAALTGASV